MKWKSFTKFPVMISHFNTGSSIYPYHTVFEHWTILFKLCGLYQMLYDILHTIKKNHTHDCHHEYSIAIRKEKGGMRLRFYKILMSFILEEDLKVDDNMFVHINGNVLRYTTIYTYFKRVRDTIDIIVMKQYQLTEKDMRDFNIIYKLIVEE